MRINYEFSQDHYSQKMINFHLQSDIFDGMAVLLDITPPCPALRLHRKANAGREAAKTPKITLIKSKKRSWRELGYKVACRGSKKSRQAKQLK